jgi:hypothetical protein
MTGWIKGGPESVWFRRLFGSFLAGQKEHRTGLNLLSQKKMILHLVIRRSSFVAG